MTNYCFIGDIHSQYQPLSKAVDYAKTHQLTPIFLGDLFDSRCDISQSVEVYNLIRLCEKDLGGIILQSNHQDKLIRWIGGNNVTINNGLDRTISDFTESGIEFNELLQWLIRMPYGIVLKNSNNTEFRCSHAYFSSTIDIPEYEDYYLIKAVNKKNKNKLLYGCTDSNGNRRLWWNEKSNHSWIRISGHYHTVYMDSNSIILDGECGNENGELCLYDLNNKKLLKF